MVMVVRTRDFLLVSYIIFWPINCQTGQNAIDLTDYLFDRNRYNKRIRPRLNQSEIIAVNVSFTLLTINGLSEVTETLKTTGYLDIDWIDQFLTWNDADFGGLNYYQWPQADIWKPDVALKNSYIDYEELGVDTLNVEVWSDGTVYWYPFQVFQSTCSVDIFYFPFDIQTCKMIFVAWSYTPYEVTLHSSGTGIYLDRYESNPEWDILTTESFSGTDDGTPTMTFALKLKRKPLYVLLAIIMPITMLSLLNIFVFILPCDSGEKAGYAITVFLAFAVFLTIVSSTLPRNSESVAIFSVFLIIQTIQSTLITLIALLLIHCNSYGDHIPVPKLLKWFLQLITCSVCLTKKKRKISPEQDNISVVSADVWANSDSKLITKITEKASEQQKDGKITEREPRLRPVNDMTWKEAVQKLERICLTFFVLVFLVSFVVCAGVAASQR